MLKAKVDGNLVIGLDSIEIDALADQSVLVLEGESVKGCNKIIIMKARDSGAMKKVLKKINPEKGYDRNV
jgi:hypothetical protein